MNLDDIKGFVAQCCLLDARFFCSHDDQGCGCETPLKRLPDPWLELIANYNPAGFIWFKENLVTTHQIRDLNHQLNEAYSSNGFAAPIISIDQEGGRVVRTPLDETTGFAGNMALGAAKSKELAEAVANALSIELRALGFNLNFAPCIDVNNNSNNPVINVRSFGESAREVATLGAAFCRGMRAAEVKNSLKHFPGHGNTDVDSHLGLPSIDSELQEALKLELAPFKKLIKQNLADTVMLAHIQFPALDHSMMCLDSGELLITPATFSKKIVSDYLRCELGFKGVTISDALDMGAIAKKCNSIEAAYRAIAAGIDVLLMPKRMQSTQDLQSFDEFLEGVAKRVQADPAVLQRLMDARERVDHFRMTLPTCVLSPQVLRCEKHLRLERQLINASFVALDSFTPIVSGDEVVVWSSMEGIGELVCHELIKLGVHAKTLSKLNQHKNEMLIVITQTPEENAVDDGRPDGLVKQLGREVNRSLMNRHFEAAKRAFWLSTRSPYELKNAPSGVARFASFNYRTALNEEYGALSPLYHHFAHVIMGTHDTQASLPVTIDA